MKNLEVRGVIPPIITPFNEKGEPDFAIFGDLLEFVLKHVHGLYPLGTYGSGPLMPKEMRIKVAEFIVKKVNHRVPVILHVGSADTATAVELARAAEAAGADAVASIVPFYYRYDERCLFEHFAAIMDAVRIPFYVYNNPGMGNNPISPTLLKKLADRGLKGIKDSSFDILTFYTFKRSINRSDFDFIIGTEALLLAARMAGAKACVSGVANAFPELMAEFFNELEKNNFSRAMELQQMVNNIRQVMHTTNSIIAIHAMLQLRGIKSGIPRRPLLPADDEILRKIKEGLEALKLL
jgi:4-hydroxy-tetrahydrodipicolinate synthase